MTPSNNEVQVKKIQNTVFDLTTFDSVVLTKNVPMPVKPTSIEEALVAVENDRDALLKVIYDGLCERAIEQAKQTIEGFLVVGEDGEPGEQYTGKYADEDKTKLINAAVLTLAKMQAGGGWDTLDKSAKKNLKSGAVEFLRANPAMLVSLQG
jgi:hypothetical protein